jgi:rhodanese-related sulfurtransferase
MSTNTITLSEFRRLLESGRPLNIIDVRTPAEFARVHALGAHSAPLDALDPLAIDTRRRDSKDPIYVICQSGGRATKACERLKAAGVGPVHSIEGGTAAWERMGLPVERGDVNIISLERQVRIGAGSMVLLGLALAWGVHPLLLVIPALVGAGLVFAGVTDSCGMALVLGKMPWNRRRGATNASTCRA